MNFALQVLAMYSKAKSGLLNREMNRSGAISASTFILYRDGFPYQLTSFRVIVVWMLVISLSSLPIFRKSMKKILPLMSYSL